MCEKKKVKLHISENFVAYRVPANFSIYAKKHHHYTVIYFLTDLQKMSSLENNITSKSASATSHEASATSHESSFKGETNRNRTQKEHFLLDSLYKTNS